MPVLLKKNSWTFSEQSSSHFSAKILEHYILNVHKDILKFILPTNKACFAEKKYLELFQRKVPHIFQQKY